MLDDIRVSSIDGSSNGTDKSKRKNASGGQRAKPKKRKLRSIDEQYEDEEQEQGEHSRNSSRSRCF